MKEGFIMKMTKKDTMEFIRANASKVGADDQGLKDIIVYTLKGYDENPRNVSMAEAQEVFVELQAAIAGGKQVSMTETQVAVETSSKKKSLNKKGSKKTEKEDVDTGKLASDIVNSGDLEEVAVDKDDKKDGKSDKAPAKDTDKKGSKKKSDKKTGKKSDLADKEMFPEKLETSVGKLEKLTDINSFEDIQKLIDEDVTVVLAMYWSKRLLKQFDYDPLHISNEPVVEFENDLDLYQPVYITENGKAAYFVSLYTEVATTITKDCLEVVDGMRYVNGAEFDFYKIVSDK